MKKWKKDVEIDAPIDVVWQLFAGDIEDKQKVMPSLFELEKIKETEEEIGSIYKQVFKSGSRFQFFEVNILDYQDNNKEKFLEEQFVHGKMFQITTSYRFKQLADGKTLFTYATETKPLKWYLRLFMLLNSGRAAGSFVNHVKNVAEREAGAEVQAE